VLLAALASAAVAAACPANAASGLGLPARTGQLLTVEAKAARTTYASLQRWQRGADGCWFRVGRAVPARVGWNGIRANRREGDGTTPAGTFPIGRTMYGTAPDPGVRFAYRRLRCGDWWDEDPRSRTYNTFVHVPCGTRPPFRTTTPGMWEQPRPYPHLAVVEFNMDPVVPGRGSGIFLHAETGGPTNGCVSLRRGDLVTVLRWLRPARAPAISIGTSATLRP
jgi:L,D-peptidoglycan transpeptidase YkuD (ErfK/YbiS/YcfS/YnhG family)